jgi:hypothetical protein
MFEELQQLGTNITEDRLEEGFRNRLTKLFDDVNSLNHRYPQKSSFEGLSQRIEDNVI